MLKLLIISKVKLSNIAYCLNYRIDQIQVFMLQSK